MPGTREHRQVQGRPRRNVVDDDHVGVYHVWSRCVRRAWLCGQDPLTGKDWRHRKAWFFERLQELTAIFAIDACVWAILANHYHLILRNRPDLAAQWSDVGSGAPLVAALPGTEGRAGAAGGTDRAGDQLAAGGSGEGGRIPQAAEQRLLVHEKPERVVLAGPMARRVFTATFGRNVSSAVTSSMWEPFWRAASTWTSTKFALTWRPRRRTPPIRRPIAASWPAFCGKQERKLPVRPPLRRSRITSPTIPTIGCVRLMSRTGAAVGTGGRTIVRCGGAGVGPASGQEHLSGGQAVAARLSAGQRG